MRTERNRQQQVLPMAGDIANQEYADCMTACSASADCVKISQADRQQDAASRWDFNQNAAGVNLDQYLARIQGAPGGTSTSSSPIYRNRGAGALGGAIAGYGLGDQFGEWRMGRAWGWPLGSIRLMPARTGYYQPPQGLLSDQPTQYFDQYGLNYDPNYQPITGYAKLQLHRRDESGLQPCDVGSCSARTGHSSVRACRGSWH
jgi:hypothetical protein